MATPKTLRFENLAEGHLSRVMEIEKQSNTSAWSERSFRHEIEHRDGIFLVALVEGQVAGYAAAWLVIDEAHITTLAVAPEQRRNGIGMALTRELLKRAAQAGMTCATLEVRAGNSGALALYERLGFEAAGVRKRYYPDNREDAVVMWLHDLCGAIG